MATSFTSSDPTFIEHRAGLAEKILDLHAALQPRVAAYTPIQRQKCLRDIDFYLDCLAEAMAAREPILFTHSLKYLKELLSSLKIPLEDLQDSLSMAGQAIQEHFPNDFRLADEYLRLGQEILTTKLEPTETFLRPGAPLNDVARAYLDLMLAVRRPQAVDLIFNALDAGVEIQDIYLHVFEPALKEVGRLWQNGSITVAAEHFFSVNTQFIMSVLYPRIFRNIPKNGQRILMACCGLEMHEIGARCVTDFFEMEGWDTIFLGANTPLITIPQAVTEYRPHILALSITLVPHIRQVATTVAAVRSANSNHDLKIIVGGAPFNLAPGLWQTVGADGSATDARQAIALARRLTWLPD